jgi:hypothetical protein
MEVVSMLAGEPFTDHPNSASPTIASFLRAYNDSIDDRRRQDLQACAAKLVGSRGSTDVEWARAERLATWASELDASRWRRFVPFRRPQAAPRYGELPPFATQVIGSRPVAAITRHTDKTHAAALAMVDELLAIGHSHNGYPADR